MSWTRRINSLIELIPEDAISSAARVLDAGCGCGGITALLTERWPNKEVIGAELHPRKFEEARSLPIKVVRSHLNHLPFPDGYFGLVFAMRVWLPPRATFRHGKRPQSPYRFDGEPTSLRDLARVLSPSGRLALEVWSEVDEQSILAHPFAREGLRIERWRRLEDDTLVTLVRR